VSADEKDENDAPLDLSEWEPQSPPSDFAERVLAKVKPPKAAQRRKPVGETDHIRAGDWRILVQDDAGSVLDLHA
jgi:hypothetical protein